MPLYDSFTSCFVWFFSVRIYLFYQNRQLNCSICLKAYKIGSFISRQNNKIVSILQQPPLWAPYSSFGNLFYFDRRLVKHVRSKVCFIPFMGQSYWHFASPNEGFRFISKKSKTSYWPISRMVAAVKKLVECRTLDREIAGSNLTRGALLCPSTRHFIFIA